MLLRKILKGHQTEIRHLLRTALCGTPQFNTAVKEVEKKSKRKIKAQPSSPHPDLLGSLKKTSRAQPEKPENNNQRRLSEKQNNMEIVQGGS